MSRRPALGRGLAALIPGAESNDQPASGLQTLPLGEIRAAHNQPRVLFDEARLQELADSIRSNGVLQPILVRRVARGEHEIIAGERRFRAATLAGLQQVPVVIREASPAEAFELALVENIQREDLDPLEEAEAYRHLLESQGLTQEQVAQRVGKDRTTVANSLRLLRLPEPLRDAIRAGELTAGHARALMTLAGNEALMQDLADKASEEGWSVRETERQARRARETPAEPSEDEAESSSASRANEAVEDQLRSALGAPVRLVQRGGKGRVEIRFHSLEELERLIDMLEGLRGL